jgi:putative lipoprotein (rSAM/lipoprotein system)
MKARIKHLYEIIAGAILSLLGFASCKIIGPDMYGPVAEYGMPHASFKLVGDVKSEDGNPIEGIVVKFRQIIDSEYPNEIEFKSGKDGKVDESFTEWPEVENIELTFEDIDGEENGGEFLRDTLKRKDLKVEFTEDKDSHWHKGDYKISFEAKLKKK